jgi:hypothetical protein
MGISQRIERPYLRARTWRLAPHLNEGPKTAAGRVEWGRVAALPSPWGKALDAAHAPHRWAVWVAAPGASRLAIVETRLRAALSILRSHGVDRVTFDNLRAASPDLRVGRHDSTAPTQDHAMHATAINNFLATLNLAPVEHIVLNSPPEQC